MRSSFRTGGLSSCLTVGMLAALAVGCGGPGETAAPPPPDVGVAKPIKRDVTVFSEHLGSTAAYESVEVRARVTGELEQINFEPSTMVEEGEQLFLIEPRNYKAERDAADAALKSAEAELARTESDLKRVEQAVKTNAVSQSDVDLARANRDMARASVLSAEAELDRSELQLSYTQVRAPITGQVGRNMVDRGNIVSGTERTVLTTVNRMQPMFAYFDAPEEIVEACEQGDDLVPRLAWLPGGDCRWCRCGVRGCFGLGAVRVTVGVVSDVTGHQISCLRIPDG